MGSRSQATKVVKAARIQMVINMLQAGRYHYQIVNELSDSWQCSSRNVEKYITAAFKLIGDHYDKNAIESILSKYDLLYERSLKAKDYKGAAKILDSISKRKGLDVTRIDHTTNGKDLPGTTVNIIKPNE